MDWKDTTDLFSLEVESLKLQALPGHMTDGVVLSLENQPVLRAFSISDPGFEQQTDLTYVRGRDLFSSFQKEHVTAECYWRLPNSFESNGSASVIQMESIVSLRSSKLSIDRIRFSLAVSSLIENPCSSEDANHVLTSSDTGFAWCVLSHPDDADDVTLDTSKKGTQIDIDIPWLERGVIRRIRILLSCWSSIPDQEEIERIAKQFADSEIPLTT